MTEQSSRASDFVTPEDLDTYFREARRFGIGGWTNREPELTVTSTDGNEHSLFECLSCAALVVDVESHIMWHKGRSRTEEPTNG